MRTPVALLCLLLSSAPVASSQELVIEDLGLGGVLPSPPTPTRILLRVENASPDVRELEIRVTASAPRNFTDRFSQFVRMGPGESRSFEYPILSPPNADFLGVRAELLDADGTLLDQDVRWLQDRYGWRPTVALLCGERSCKEFQRRIVSGGLLERQGDRERDWTLVQVQDPPDEWWGYAPASAVVLAEPIARVSVEERTALVDHLKSGGQLLLLEPEVPDQDFLSSYRRKSAEGQVQRVGLGTLVRIESLEGSQLDAAWSELSIGGASYWTYLRPSVLAGGRGGPWKHLLDRLTTPLSFPGPGRLLVWLFAYVLAVGPLNMLLLEQRGGREWGWLTIPLVALGFSTAIYGSSLSSRPSGLVLDDIHIYSMDDRSPDALVSSVLKLTSPSRRELSLRIPEETVIQGAGYQAKKLSFATALGEAAASSRRRPFRLELSMPPWSNGAAELAGFRRFPGTVRFAGDQVLRNETGRSFQQALYVDERQVYLLGEVSADEEIELTHTRSEPLRVHQERFSNERDEDRFWEESQAQPFSLVELLWGANRPADDFFEHHRGFFVGLSAGADLDLELENVEFTRNSHSLTIVSFLTEP